MMMNEQVTLYRYATALNNIGVAVMERHVFDEASCILEDAATVAQSIVSTPTTADELNELLHSLPSTLQQAAQRLAVISSRKQTHISAVKGNLRVVSTSLDDWSPQSLLRFVEDGPSKELLFGIRLETSMNSTAQMNLELGVIVQNWAVATYGWSQSVSTVKDTRALAETSVSLFHNSIHALKCSGPLSELNQQCLRLLTGWVIGVQNLGTVMAMSQCAASQLNPIREELYGLVQRLVNLDNRICVFSNELGPACAA